MPLLTPDEIARWRELYPTLPLEGDAPTGAMQAAPALAAPAISTGQAPPSLAAPNSISARLEQLAAESKAREAAMGQGPGFGVKDALALGIAGAGDAASRIAAIKRGGGGPGATNTFGAMLEARQKAETQRAAGVMEERKFQATVLNQIGQSNSRDLENRQKAYAILADTLKNPAATEEDRQSAADEAIGFLAQNGQDVTATSRVFKGMIRRPEIALLVGDYAKAYDPKNEDDQKRWKLLESEIFALTFSGPEGVAKIPERIKSVVAAKVGPEVTKAVLETARNLRGLPEFKNGIPISVLYDKFIGKYGEAGAKAYIDFLQGQLVVGAEGQTKYQNLQTAMTDAGFKGLDVAGKAQAAGAVRAAEQAQTLQPEVRDLLKGRGIVNPDPKNPVDAAAIDAAIKEVEVARPAAKAGATRRAELAPDIVAGEAARAGAVATAQEPSQARVAAATGREAATRAQEFAQKKPVGAKDRAGYVDITALQQTGDVVQPPAGITQGDLDKSGRYAFIEDKQKEALRGLRRSEGLLGSVLGFADRSITATTGEAAIRQVVDFKTNEYLARNPVAKTFVETRDAFLGSIARDLGGERGVLTDRDIERVRKAIPGPWDTVATKDLKKALIADLIATSRNALIAEVTGQSPAGHRRQLAELLDAIEKVQSPGLEIESIRRK